LQTEELVKKWVCLMARNLFYSKSTGMYNDWHRNIQDDTFKQLDIDVVEYSECKFKTYSAYEWVMFLKDLRTGYKCNSLECTKWRK
jgi:hypothetical protein